MIKWIRKLLNLCDHEWKHASNDIADNGKVVEILYCDKCHRFKTREWPRSE